MCISRMVMVFRTAGRTHFHSLRSLENEHHKVLTQFRSIVMGSKAVQLVSLKQNGKEP